METARITLPVGPPAKTILSLLSWYPLMWTAAILLGGLFKSHFLIMCTMATWVVYLYIGSLTWLTLMIYLPLKKRITLKQSLTYILVLIIGIIAAWLVVEFDILASGVKYMD